MARHRVADLSYGRAVSRALITGGAGFIGGHLAQRLLERGMDLLIVDDLSWGRRERLQASPRVQFVEGSIVDLPRVLPDMVGVTHVFHLAALISAYESLEKPDAYFNVNINGLLRVLERCRGISPRLVFASTSGVYGNTEAPTKRETDLPSPATVYASTKLAGEHLLAMYRSRLGFDDVSLRFFNVYGPGQSPKHPYANVTCRFSRAAALGGEVELFGDGGQTRDFIFIDDVIDAVCKVAFAPVKARVYNVGTGRDASIASLLESVQRLGGARMKVQRRDAWPNDIRHIRADISTIQRDFDFAPRVSLDDGLASTVDFFRSAGEDW